MMKLQNEEKRELMKIDEKDKRSILNSNLQILTSKLV